MARPEEKELQELAKDIRPDSEFKSLDEVSKIFYEEFVVSSTSILNQPASQVESKETKSTN